MKRILGLTIAVALCTAAAVSNRFTIRFWARPPFRRPGPQYRRRVSHITERRPASRRRLPRRLFPLRRRACSNARVATRWSPAELCPRARWWDVVELHTECFATAITTRRRTHVATDACRCAAWLCRLCSQPSGFGGEASLRSAGRHRRRRLCLSTGGSRTAVRHANFSTTA